MKSQRCRGIVQRALPYLLLCAVSALATPLASAGPASGDEGSSSVYRVNIERTLKIEPTNRLQSKVLREGWEGVRGHPGVRAFMTHIINLAMNRGVIDVDLLNSDRTMIMDIQETRSSCDYIVTLQIGDDSVDGAARDDASEYSRTLLIRYPQRCVADAE